MHKETFYICMYPKLLQANTKKHVRKMHDDLITHRLND